MGEPDSTRAPSIIDVAALAGVSRQTVSRVINDHPAVSPPTRKRVRAAIEQLGYRRNAAARTLASKRSNVLGVAVTNMQLSGPSGALLGIDQAARRAGYWVSVTFLRSHTKAEMDAALLHFLDQGAEGAVVIAPNQATLDAAAPLAGSLPMVLATSGDTADLRLPSVDIDQYAGASKAVRHLIELGHREIGHICGPEEEFQAVRRAEAWRKELGKAGLPLGPCETGDWQPSSGYEIGKRLARNKDELPTALFVGNDQMALGVLRAFTEAGIKVPQDVSLVGFDNSVGADNFVPPLTTINQDFSALGELCLDLVIDLIAGREPISHQVVPDLVVRASTSPPQR
ncbi:MAG: LacI family transcriptional regulator [Propionibacteriaceae bacterium]|jgi:DNA-binding LacI/PurR family transcriptional regulator|nr:LacI family transcriptional regulator [Propionibacteriaceae bacterium]